MNFKTEIQIDRCKAKIEHSSKILTIGSCFAENIAAEFKFYFFNVFENPFGVLYNPASIYNALKISSEEKLFTAQDLLFDKEEWHSLFHHSDFSHHNQEECLKRINTRTAEVNKFLRHCDWVIISLGTSFVYNHKEKNIIVSNCHRIPPSNFDRRILTVEETENYLNGITAILKAQNPDVKVLFTVSPVRHIKDGFAENQLSKSSLIVALHRVIKKNENCFYFPSYEIVMDDLRDYRFYEKDMLHPNKIAIEYIWEKFAEFCFSEDCKTAVKEIEPYSKGINHRLRDVDSPNAKKFLESVSARQRCLHEKYPYIEFKKE